MFGAGSLKPEPTFEQFREWIDEKLEVLSRIDAGLLRRLASANEEELSAVELVFEAHAEDQGSVESKLDQARGKERKKR